MKLKAHEVANYLRAPDPSRAALLLFGTDAVRIADGRAQAVLAIGGPNVDQDMRVTTLNAGELRKDPASLIDNLKAKGFFEGPRVVVIQDVTDTQATVITHALEAWEIGDATLVVTAGNLTPRSKLRKLFEGSGSAVAAPIYDSPMSRDEISSALADAGFTQIPNDAHEALTAQAASLEPGDFRQMLTKLMLYKQNDQTPVGVDDISACAPLSAEADLDQVLDIICEGKVGEIGPTLSRLYAQGVAPVGLCIGALRQFRSLHRVASDPGGAASGIAKLKPPVFGPRRDKMQRQASRWGAIRLEKSIIQITKTDLALRSAGKVAPDHAMVERLLIRLAMMASNIR